MRGLSRLTALTVGRLKEPGMGGSRFSKPASVRLSASWRLRYAPGAEPVSTPNAAARIAAAAQGQSDQIAASIMRGSAGMH